MMEFINGWVFLGVGMIVSIVGAVLFTVLYTLRNKKKET